MQKIQEKIPADPFEAELLMMAEMVASDKKDEGGTTDEDSNAAGRFTSLMNISCLLLCPVGTLKIYIIQFAR